MTNEESWAVAFVENVWWRDRVGKRTTVARLLAWDREWIILLARAERIGVREVESGGKRKKSSW